MQHQDLDKGATRVFQSLPVGDIVPEETLSLCLLFGTGLSWMLLGITPGTALTPDAAPESPCATVSYLTWVHSQAHTLKWPNSAASEIKFSIFMKTGAR